MAQFNTDGGTPVMEAQQTGRPRKRDRKLGSEAPVSNQPAPGAFPAQQTRKARRVPQPQQNAATIQPSTVASQRGVINPQAGHLRTSEPINSQAGHLRTSEPINPMAGRIGSNNRPAPVPAQPQQAAAQVTPSTVAAQRTPVRPTSPQAMEQYMAQARNPGQMKASFSAPAPAPKQSPQGQIPVKPLGKTGGFHGDGWFPKESSEAWRRMNPNWQNEDWAILGDVEYNPSVETYKQGKARMKDFLAKEESDRKALLTQSLPVFGKAPRMTGGVEGEPYTQEQRQMDRQYIRSKGYGDFLDGSSGQQAVEALPPPSAQTPTLNLGPSNQQAPQTPVARPQTTAPRYDVANAPVAPRAAPSTAAPGPTLTNPLGVPEALTYNPPQRTPVQPAAPVVPEGGPAWWQPGRTGAQNQAALGQWASQSGSALGRAAQSVGDVFNPSNWEARYSGAPQAPAPKPLAQTMGMTSRGTAFPQSTPVRRAGLAARVQDEDAELTGDLGRGVY